MYNRIGARGEGPGKEHGWGHVSESELEHIITLKMLLPLALDCSLDEVKICGPSEKFSVGNEGYRSNGRIIDAFYMSAIEYDSYKRRADILYGISSKTDSALRDSNHATVLFKDTLVLITDPEHALSILQTYEHLLRETHPTLPSSFKSSYWYSDAIGNAIRLAKKVGIDKYLKPEGYFEFPLPRYNRPPQQGRAIPAKKHRIKTRFRPIRIRHGLPVPAA